LLVAYIARKKYDNLLNVELIICQYVSCVVWRPVAVHA
jgi:hypothetical protein